MNCFFSFLRHIENYYIFRESVQLNHSFKKMIRFLKTPDKNKLLQSENFLENNLKNQKLKNIIKEEINSLTSFKLKKEVILINIKFIYFVFIVFKIKERNRAILFK